MPQKICCITSLFQFIYFLTLIPSYSYSILILIYNRLGSVIISVIKSVNNSSLRLEECAQEEEMRFVWELNAPRINININLVRTCFKMMWGFKRVLLSPAIRLLLTKECAAELSAFKSIDANISIQTFVKRKRYISNKWVCLFFFDLGLFT